MNFETTNHSNLYLSIGSCVSSILSFFMAFVTDYHIMGLLGLVCVIVSVWAGILTIKEKRLNIKAINENRKKKTGGRF